MSGAEVRVAREELGLSRTDMAHYLGVSFWTLAQWEAGRRKVSMDDFSVRVALATARKAHEDGEPLPDWRRYPVLPALVVLPGGLDEEAQGEESR